MAFGGNDEDPAIHIFIRPTTVSQDSPLPLLGVGRIGSVGYTMVIYRHTFLHPMNGMDQSIHLFLSGNGDALRCSMARLCSDAKVASWMMLSGTPALLCTALAEGQRVLQEFDSICLGFSDLFTNNVGQQELHYIQQNASVYIADLHSLPSNWSIPC